MVQACGEGVISSERSGWKVTCGSSDQQQDQQQPATSSPTPTTTPVPIPAQTAAPQPTTCRTSVAGEECHGAVTWAKETGIQLHPDWYPGLSIQSTFEEFQHLLHRGGHGPGQNGVANYAGCDLPCRTSSGSSSGSVNVLDRVCAPFSQWPDIDGGVACNDCTALVLTAPYGNSCDTYCQSFGHVCAAAAEEVNEDCAVKYSAQCDEVISDTSDMLCTCLRV